MKKRLCMLLTIAMLLSLCACAQAPAEQKPAEPETAEESAAATEEAERIGLANPWRDITEDEARELCIKSFSAPAGAENVRWSAMDAAADESGVPGALVQLSFDLEGLPFTAREQITGEEEADLSGLYYDWTAQREEKLKNAEGAEMTAQVFRHVGEGEDVDLCTWHDIEAGVSYSLGVIAEDLDGFDLLAVAGSLFG